jgi:two-component system KDP operon response regulator KdpE
MSGEPGPGPGGPGPGPTLLLVEDDEATRTALRRDLVSRGFRVDDAVDGSSALARWAARRPDAILLDLGLPDMDGVRVIRRVRREAQTPILVLSARDAEAAKVEALEAGADDYVTKPFGIAELQARLRALLRRAAGPAADAAGRVRVGDLVLDVARHAVTIAGAPVDLTPREFEVLRVLLTHGGRVVTRGRLLRAVWGTAYSGEDHYVHVFVSQVRRKISAADPDGRLRDLIVTEPGVGYRVRALDGPAADAAGQPDPES